MSTHLQRHRAELAALAFPAVEAFITKHPDYAIAPNQSGSLSNTNYVIFGLRGTEPVIFKYFCEDERKEREVYALRHFANTGLVPNLLADVDARLIVQSRIPGDWLPNRDHPAFDTVDTHRAGYTLGQAVASLLNVPLETVTARNYESRFYDGLQLEGYFRTILDASWLIYKNVAAYNEQCFAQSLESIEANLPYILGQRRRLYHQDALNMHFMESRFTGFFDLEMCRVGTEAMQIGSLWQFFATHDNWGPFAQGFAAISKRQLAARDFAAAQAFAHFLVWRYISRYGRWRGDAKDLATLEVTAAEVANYAHSIEDNVRVQF